MLIKSSSARVETVSDSNSRVNFLHATHSLDPNTTRTHMLRGLLQRRSRLASLLPSRPLCAASSAVITSRCKPVNVPEAGVLDFLVEHGKWRDKSMAAKPAIIDTASGETLRYGELEARINGCAHALHALGFRQGDVLAVHLHNCTEFIVAFMAAASLGGLTSPSNPAYVAEELARQIQDSGAKLLLSSTRYSKAVHGALAELQARDVRGSQALALTRVAFIEDADCFARAPSHAAPVPLVRPIDARRDVAVLPYSSGTTGRPKGVQLSHHNLVANVIQLNADPFARLAFDESDTLLGLLPLYHIYGMTVLMLGALAYRATLVLLPKFEPSTFFGAIEKHRVSVACLVPPLCLFLAKDPSVAGADLSSLKYIYSGAAPLDAALELAVVKRLGGRVRVRQVYGMTELSPIVLAGGEHDHVPGSSGRLVASTVCKIVAPETGKALPLGAEGELLIRGPQVMLGYKDRPDANAEVLVPVSEAERLIGGVELGAWWLRTGDVARVDADGNVYISERIKELIKVHADWMHAAWMHFAP